MAAFDDFVIATNPDEDSTLPYLIRLPLPNGPVILKVRDTWPRTAKVYCHRSDDWPADPEILERVPVRSCRRRGAAIDLVLDRGRENRSQFVFTRARGRDMIFWQSARTRKQARPNVSTPTARASGLADLTIVVDSNERYAWRFSAQQVDTVRRKLPAGDYGVEVQGVVVAAVERKSLADLVSTMTGGKLWYLLSDLTALERAAVVVEDRYSQVFKLDRVRPVVVAEGLAEAAVRYPSVPILFAETRPLAQEWTYRFLGAALVEHHRNKTGEQLAADLPTTSLELPVIEPTTAEVRSWARSAGLDVPDRGRLRPEIWDAYRQANTST